jgi:hypothetical protein
MRRLVSAVSRLWHADRPLTATGLVMLPLLALTLVGLWADPRMIAGAPAWLKPAKFAASIAIYTLTLAWLFTWLPAWRRTRRVVGITAAVVFVLEFAIIAAQAARGTTSHFNIGSPLDAVLFSVMGAAIIVQTLTSVAVAVALWRQPFADRALGVALRLGMTLTIVGASTGGLMTSPTATQLEAARAGERMLVAGAHTVGAPDGGPGLPGTGWSREHGDLRVPHFVGLHAIQALPLIVLIAGRRAAGAVRTRLACIAAASYATFFVLLLAQARRGQSVLQPDALSALMFAAWALLTGGAAWVALSRRPSPHTPLVTV